MSVTLHTTVPKIKNPLLSDPAVRDPAVSDRAIWPNPSNPASSVYDLAKPQQRNTGPKPQGFSESELAQFQRVDKNLTQVYKTEKNIDVSLNRLYRLLSSLSPLPASKGILSWFTSKKSKNIAEVQKKISDKVLELKKLHKDHLRQEEHTIRQKHSGKCFVMDNNTPEILKRVAIPESKTVMSYETLRTSLEKNLNKSNPKIKIECPSAERTIIYRQRSDKSWETLELSWRLPGKVDVIKNGVVLGNLYNCDALKGAQEFIKGHNINLTPKKYPPDTVWKIV